MTEAFYGCTSLSPLILPEGLATIGGCAFAGCSSLTSLKLPEGLTTIGENAFTGCTILEQRSMTTGHLNVVSYLRFALLPCVLPAATPFFLLLSREAPSCQASCCTRDRRSSPGGRPMMTRTRRTNDAEGEEQAGVLGVGMIHSDDLWRYIEFVTK